MRHGRIVYVIGDVHGDFGSLNRFINRRIRLDRSLKGVADRWKQDGDDFQVMILQCGDFAYFWPGEDSRGRIRNQVDWHPGGRIPVYWTGGNHEDWDRLDALGPGIAEVDRGIFHCPFGSTLEVSPDITVLFAGGAESHDIDERLGLMAQGEPECWWEQEGVSEVDLGRLEYVSRADWVVSHTAPAVFQVADRMPASRGCEADGNEPSRGRLNQVLRRFSPSRWFFGHFHRHMAGRTDGCDWMCLGELSGCGRSWERIWLEWED